MFIDLGQQVSLSEEQFQQEMAKRRERNKSDVIIGCPLCNVAIKPAPPTSSNQNQPRHPQ